MPAVLEHNRSYIVDPNYSESFYFAYPAVSRSFVKSCLKCEEVNKETVHEQWVNPTQFKANTSMQLGKAFEQLVLEPDRFNRNFVITEYENWNQRRKQLKAIRQTGVEPIKRSQFQLLEKMRDFLMQSQFPKGKQFGFNTVKDIFDADIRTQVMRVFTLNDVVCKCLVDIIITLPDGSLLLIDLKTSRSIFDGNTFFYDSLKYGYDLQAAFYVEGFRDLGVVDYFPFIIANTQMPNMSNTYAFHPSFLKKTLSKISIILEIHKKVNSE